MTIASSGGSEAIKLLRSLKFSMGAAAIDNLAAFLACPAKLSPAGTGTLVFTAAAIAAGAGAFVPLSTFPRATAVGVVS